MILNDLMHQSGTKRGNLYRLTRCRAATGHDKERSQLNNPVY